MSEINLSKRLTSKIVNSFLKYYNKLNKENSTKCWIWPGTIESNGYGRFIVDDIHYLAHRISLLYHNNMIQSELQVLHKLECKYRSCVNPNHLYFGNHYNNMSDAVKAKTASCLDRQGENCPTSKLTDDLILRLRFERKEYGLTLNELAERYNISFQQVSRIINRKRWKHI